MKICTLQIALALMFSGLVFSHTNYGQVLDQKVTITLEEVSIEEAFETLEGLTNVKFFYSVDQLNIEGKVSLQVVSRPLRDVLIELLTPHHVKFKLHEKRSTITLKRERVALDSGTGTKDNSKVSVIPNPAATITGKIIDAATQQPMAGVNIVVKGTTKGTSTDSNGNYSIDADNQDILIYSFIGYISFETQVSGRSVIDVTLEEDVKSLNEVVVNAGYWEVKDKQKTGNISRVSASEISNQPVNNPLTALHGRMAGVYIQQATGVPGGGVSVQIRGRNSIARGNDPLYIVDGVPVTSQTLSSTFTSDLILGSSGASPLNTINPNDIESIEVLKDADATAIYGSRGANGVVLITTKKGKPGKTSIDVNFYTGVGKVTRRADLLSTPQYIEMRREAFANDNAEPQTWNAPDLLSWDTTRYTDWQKTLIGRNSNTTNAQVSFSGGDANTQFLFSGGYYRETTVFPGDFSYHKASSHLSVAHTSPDKKFTSTFLANYVADGNNLLYSDLTWLALTLPPNAPALYKDGELNWENSTWENPLSELNRKYLANTYNLISNAVLGYELLKGLQIKANLGYNDMRMRDKSLMPSYYYNPDWGATGANAASRLSDTSLKSWIIEPQVSYTRGFSRGRLAVLAGATFQEQLRDQFVQEGKGFSSDALIENIDAATTIDVLAYNNTLYRYNALFGRINYAWEEKYIVNLTARRDGSSRFGSGNQFANFGAVGVAWIFSNEKFIKNHLAFLSFGKLRGSYGTSGNDQIGDYGYLDTYSPGGNYQGVTGLNPTRLFNPDFAWELNKKLEIGLELGFIQDRLSLSASYYKNRSSNQLVNYPLAMTTGFTGVQANLPAMVQNTGIELELQALNIGGTLQWNGSINFTVPRNKLVEFPGLEASSYANTYVVGRPLGIMKTYKTTGIDPESGIYKFEDMNNDGVITSSDKLQIKQVGQRFYGGLSNSVSYKGVRLEILFQFVKQTSTNYWYSSVLAGVRLNQPQIVMERWQKPGDENLVQRFTTGVNSPATTSLYHLRESDLAISTSSFVRLKTLSLSYTFPSKSIGGANVRLYFQGQNLLTISDYKGMDPELAIAYGTLPPLKVFSAGIQLTL